MNKQERALAQVANAAAVVREDALALHDSRRELTTAIRKAHATGVGYGTIAASTGATDDERITRSRVAQIVKEVG